MTLRWQPGHSVELPNLVDVRSMLSSWIQRSKPQNDLLIVIVFSSVGDADSDLVERITARFLGRVRSCRSPRFALTVACMARAGRPLRVYHRTVIDSPSSTTTTILNLAIEESGLQQSHASPCPLSVDAAIIHEVGMSQRV